MHIGLIGMSGAGKSYWAERLAEVGYQPLHCDALIAQRLSAQVGRSLVTVEDLGAWMGLPDSPGFREREAHYLALEGEVMAEIDGLLTGRGNGQPCVVDMTGSAIYVADGILSRLCSHLTTVYLSISPQVQAEMLAAYLDRPRPIIWDGCYRPHPQEATSATLARCYPALIAHRERHYARLADVTIPYEDHRRPDLSVTGLLAWVRRGQ